MTTRRLALSLSLALACNKPAPAPTPAPTPAPAPAPYSIVAKAEPCAVNAPCKVSFVVEPHEGFHVNDEYPYKLLVDELPNVTFLGAPDPRTFSKSTGDYASEGPRVARVAARFKAASPGTLHVQGTLKLSVCSDEACHIDAAQVRADVDVTP